MRGAELALKQTQRHGRRQEDRVHQGLVRRQARRGRERHAQAGRAGQGRHHGRPAVRRRGHRGQGLRQDPAATSPSSTARRARRRPRWSTRRRTSSASTPKARSGWSAWARHALDKGYKKRDGDRRGLRASRTRRCRASWPSTAAKGGKVPDKAWVPLGSKDYSSVIAKIPKDVDALLVVLGGADAVNFLTQYEQAGGDKPMVGGSITVDQTSSTTRASAAIRWSARSSAGPMADAYDDARVEDVRRRLQEDHVHRTASRARRCSPTCTTST